MIIMRLFAVLFLLFLSGGPLMLMGQSAPKRIVPADTNVILPPAWAFGILYGGYTDQEGTIERVNEIMEHDYPIDAYWIDSWFWSYADKGRGPKKYIDFAADTISYPDRQTMWSYLQRHGIKGGFWTWDCIQETGNEKAFNEFKEKGLFSRIFFNTNSWHNGSTSTAMFLNGQQKRGTYCGDINFDDPKAVALFRKRMKHFFDEGADFIKLDRTSKISVCKAMFGMSQDFGKETRGRGFLLSHTGGMQSEEYKRYPAKWTDDTRSDWTIENPLIAFNDWVPKVALKENIAMYTNPAKATSRILFLTNDMGGFDMGKTSRPEEELFIRWMQFSMYCPITEVFSQPENPTSNLAWNYSARADSLFRWYAHQRMRLFPYIYSAAHAARLSGLPVIRKIPGHLYEFLLGADMLLAPVYERGATGRQVFLPDGEWINFWTGERYPGNASHFVDAPIERIPCFIRAGAIIPWRNYAPNIESGSNDTLTLSIYPGAAGEFDLIEDDGLSNDYLQSGYAITRIKQFASPKGLRVRISPAEGKYTGMKDSRSWILRVRANKKPAEVQVNHRICQFEYDAAGGIITIMVPDRSVHSALEILIVNGN